MNEDRARAIVYARSMRRCEVCGREAESVHHRNKQGRVWEPANLLHLCGDGTRYCHGWIEANPQHALALGLWVPREVSPAAVPAYVKPAMFQRDWWWLDGDGCWTWCWERAMHPDPPAHVQAALRALTASRLPLPGAGTTGLLGMR